MTKWVLVVWLSGGMYLPVLAFDSEEECWAAIEYVEPGVQHACVKAEVEKPKPKRQRK